MNQDLPGFVMKQKITMTVNRYEIRPDDNGPILAMAQQKRMALRDEVTFFADEARTQPMFQFKARQRMDVAATYDITDVHGNQLGWFKKEFAKSMLRSTWTLGVPSLGLEATGQERNATVAVLRRFLDFSWPIHFDFKTNGGDIPVASIERAWAVRDRYLVNLPAAPNGQRLDWRVGACLAVACDALMGR
ncbi:LURP-one-related/scramblase family protein [Parenemella sanctibonifatiensis]|nr:hypothetical protein [Parenemella sanctibonifatiensis]